MSSFNIETYINSLPDDIEMIDILGKRLTYIPSLKRFNNLKYLDCSFNNLTSLPELNNSLKILNCEYNKLTSLPELNDNLHELNCQFNNLKMLPNLKNLTDLCCQHNRLTSLPELNDSLQYLNCSYNQLTYLPKLNDNLKYLFCSYNQLTTLPKIINYNFIELRCYDNLLPYCIMYNNSFNLNESKINLINKINMINNTTDYLYHCKSLFWSLKFKKKFRDWLWLKVRLPKIEQLYHPSKLNELLNAEDMNEEELDNVISNWQ